MPTLYTDPDRAGQLVELLRPVPDVDGLVIVRPAGSTDPAAEFRAWLEDLQLAPLYVIARTDGAALLVGSTPAAPRWGTPDQDAEPMTFPDRLTANDQRPPYRTPGEPLETWLLSFWLDY